MRDFGGRSELLSAPASEVAQVMLIYEAEAQHARAKEWEAQVAQRWRDEGLG